MYSKQIREYEKNVHEILENIKKLKKKLLVSKTLRTIPQEFWRKKKIVY